MWKDTGSSSIAILVNRHTGQEFNISRFATSIGREFGNDLVLNSDKTVSRHHASIQYVDGQFYFHDLGSKNGSRVNGKKIAEMVKLCSGDELTVGLTQFVFVLIPSRLLNLSLPVSSNTQTLAEPALGNVAGASSK